jgi:hypothetical protein
MQQNRYQVYKYRSPSLAYLIQRGRFSNRLPFSNGKHWPLHRNSNEEAVFNSRKQAHKHSFLFHVGEPKNELPFWRSDIGQRMRMSLEFRVYRSYNVRFEYFRFGGRHFVVQASVDVDSIGLGDPENISITAGISCLSFIQREIQVLPVVQASVDVGEGRR